jgi:hypothetical protein
MSLVATPAQSLPSVQASTLLAWHLCALRDWDIPCGDPEALAFGRVEWADPEPRVDISLLTMASASRVLFLGQTQDGVVFGFFANCPLSGDVRQMDPALQSAIFVLEHPTGEQRKWQHRDPNHVVGEVQGFLLFGEGFWVNAGGFLLSGPAPDFGMTEVDASFITLRPPNDHGWSWAQILHWELWSVGVFL